MIPNSHLLFSQGGIGSLDLVAELDARLNFDEELPPLDVPALRAHVAALATRVEAALRIAKQGQLLRRGLQVRRFFCGLVNGMS